MGLRKALNEITTKKRVQTISQNNKWFRQCIYKATHPIAKSEVKRVKQQPFWCIYTRCVPIWKKFDYAKTGSRRSVELPKDL